jgi:Asp-tRNA(Asn)/Glu-tRNA(Gln) amidotransferase A subunit family amidase
MLTQQIHHVFEQGNCDVMIIPTVLFPPPKFEKDMTNHKIMNHDDDVTTEMYANDIMTVPISLTGLPSISVPMPTRQNNATAMDSDWPKFFQPSLQIVAGRGNESIIFQVAASIENWKKNDT